MTASKTSRRASDRDLDGVMQRGLTIDAFYQSYRRGHNDFESIGDEAIPNAVKSKKVKMRPKDANGLPPYMRPIKANGSATKLTKSETQS